MGIIIMHCELQYNCLVPSSQGSGPWLIDSVGRLKGDFLNFQNWEENVKIKINNLQILQPNKQTDCLKKTVHFLLE